MTEPQKDGLSIMVKCYAQYLKDEHKTWEQYTNVPAKTYFVILWFFYWYVDNYALL